MFGSFKFLKYVIYKISTHMARNFIVKEEGKYVLTEDYVIRTSSTVGIIPKGTVLNITQIDEQYKKVIGDNLSDWCYWDLPVRPYVP